MGFVPRPPSEELQKCVGKLRNCCYFCRIKRIPLILVLTLLSLSANAQFTDGTTGLLNCPSAEMNESGTFTITNNFLNKHLLTPKSVPGAYGGWDYNTY